MAIAKTRPVCETIWLDKKFRKLKRWERYLFLYLLTNTHVEQVGIYELTYETMAFETELTLDQVQRGIGGIKIQGLIDYDDDTEEVAILNFLKYSLLTGGTVTEKCFMELSKKVQSTKLLEALYDKVVTNQDSREIYQFASRRIAEAIEYKKTGIAPVIPDEENPYIKKNRKQPTQKSENKDDEELVVVETGNDSVLYYVKKYDIKNIDCQLKTLFFPVAGERKYRVFTEAQLANVDKRSYW